MTGCRVRRGRSNAPRTERGAAGSSPGNASREMPTSRYHPLGDQPSSRNPLPPPPTAVPTAAPSPRISAGRLGIRRFAPSDAAVAAAKGGSPDAGRVVQGFPR